MNSKIKNPTRGRKAQKQKNKNFNPLIIADSRAKSQGRYQKIKDIFQYSGGADEAQLYLDYWGVPSPIKDLILAYAEYDVMSGGVA
jgi:hypothetical protein